jgi:voltage-gated potassium channel
MASEAIRPQVVGFLDLMLKDQSQTLRVEEIEIHDASPWAGHPLSEIKIHPKHNLLVLAVKNAGGSGTPKLWVNPPDGLVVRTGAAIIVMGDVKNIREARREAGSVVTASQ